jgi:nucleoside-diphosphate-sugar epimerase
VSGRVLLTGASGFIGRHAVAALRARGFEVHAVSRRARPSDDGATWHAGDLAEPGVAARLITSIRPTHLLHLAWYVEHGKFWTSPENLSWVARSLDLVRAFREAGGARAVLAGTCAEYQWGLGECVEGETPLAPATLYGAAKHALRQIVESYARVTGLSAAWGRVFLLYGPDETESRLVPSVVTSILRGEPALCSEGTQLRDLLYVADVADAFAALLASDVTGAVNVASGEPVRLRDVACNIAERLGRPELLRLGARPTPAGDPPVLTARVDRLRTEVGWAPSRTLDEGLDETIRWWAERLDAGAHARSVA